MAENLSYNVEGSKCYAEGQSGVTQDSITKNCNTYGRLYDWATAMALDALYNSTHYNASEKHRGICPSGWHIPNGAEWDILMNYVQTDNGRIYNSGSTASIAGFHLKAKEGWNSYNGNSGNGGDDYGFAALPGGYGSSGGDFYSAGGSGGWWSASEINANYAYYRSMAYDTESANWNYYYKTFLQSVRCLQD
jgi:uncharacterized protein (TIGR02145 family)